MGAQLHFYAHILSHTSNETREFMERSMGRWVKGFVEAREAKFRAGR